MMKSKKKKTAQEVTVHRECIDGEKYLLCPALRDAGDLWIAIGTVW